jgi:hypothetical protein
MNTWYTLPESYPQRVCENTLVTVKRQIHREKNPMPAMVLSTEAEGFDNSIPLVYLISEVSLEEPEIGSTDQNMPIHINSSDDKLHFGRPGDNGDYKDYGDQCDKRNAITTGRRWCRAATELLSFDLGTSHPDEYHGENGDNADEKEEASHADDGSMQNVEECGHSRSSSVDSYHDEDGHDADDEEEALEVDDWSTQNAENWGHSTRECEDSTVDCWPV